MESRLRIAGQVGGASVVVAAAIDLLFVHESQAKRIGVLQNLMNMGVLILFAVILMLRMRTTDRVAGWGLLAVELIALGAAAFGAWYGGALVNRRPIPAFAQAQASRRQSAPPGACQIG